MKKELQSCFLTHKGNDYLVLIKWYKSDNETEWIVARSKEPVAIKDGGDYYRATHFFNPINAHDYYLEQIGREEFLRNR